MKTTSLCLQLKPGQSLPQALDRKISLADPEERQQMRRFLESMPAEHLNDPGNLLGHIYKQLAA